jgi:hypothetical protein
MSLRTYYKVVRKRFHSNEQAEIVTELVSVTMEHSGDLMFIPPNPYALVYPVGEWVDAKAGGLLVFADPLDAKYFALDSSNEFPTAVYRVVVEGRMRLPRQRLLSHSIEFAPQLWAGEKLTVPRAYGWPVGTRAFRRVKLLYPVDGQGDPL